MKPRYENTRKACLSALKTCLTGRLAKSLNFARHLNPTTPNRAGKVLDFIPLLFIEDRAFIAPCQESV